MCIKWKSQSIFYTTGWETRKLIWDQILHYILEIAVFQTYVSLPNAANI